MRALVSGISSTRAGLELLRTTTFAEHKLPGDLHDEVLVLTLSRAEWLAWPEWHLKPQQFPRMTAWQW